MEILTPVLFIIAGFFGVLVAFFFPLDEGGEMITTKAKLHLGLISLSGLLTITGMVVLGLDLAADLVWGSFAFFSIITALVSLILVVATTRSMGTNYLGLVERFMVSTYQVYYFVLALMVFLTNAT